MSETENKNRECIQSPEGTQVFTIEADETMEDIRLDKLLSMILTGEPSRSFCQKLIAHGRVTVNGKVPKPSLKIAAGNTIRAELLPAKELNVEAEEIPLSVLYEDEDVLIVNKPKGMVVHPAPGHMNHTLVNGVLYHCRGQLSGINGVLRPGIVHRIDKDTTGSLVICKNDAAHRNLAEQFATHSIKRTYRALVWGNLSPKEGTVDKPIGRDPANRKKMAAVMPGDGKRAVTHYTVLQQFDKAAYIECRLETGRTHQIRVHMASLGHPVVGDEIYGRFKAPKNDFDPSDEKAKMQAEKARNTRITKELEALGIKEELPGFSGQCLHAMHLGFVHSVSVVRI